MTKIIAICMLFFCGVGCKDSERAQISSFSKRHHITLYGCDGKAIREWISTGNVSNEGQSDGWYFKDEKTGLLVELAGTIVIEVLP